MRERKNVHWVRRENKCGTKEGENKRGRGLKKKRERENGRMTEGTRNKEVQNEKVDLLNEE